MFQNVPNQFMASELYWYQALVLSNNNIHDQIKAYFVFSILFLPHQDDIMMDTLTVRENFHFSASLRLPSHMTHQQRKERVEKVIDELGLTKCADTRV